MPHKRQSRALAIQKNSVPRHVQPSNPKPIPAPKVAVKANNGSEAENTPMGAKIKAPQMAPQQKPKPFQPTVTANVSTKSQCKLAAPQYNTTIRRQGEISTIKQMRVKVTDANITPRSKEVIAPKITKKLNFPPGHSVYTDLLTLNVNDSLMMPQRRNKGQGHLPSKNPGLVEPQLADYLKPIEPIDMPLPDQELILDFPDEPFDFFQAYKNVYYPKK